MAVELNTNRTESFINELSYFYEKEESLTTWTNILSGFSDDTRSHIQFEQDIFKPTRMHLTTKLHKGLHDYELIVEHVCNNETLFLCFPLKIGDGPGLTFPLKTSPLEKIMDNFSNTFSYYKTSTNSPVFFCSHFTYVGANFPKVLNNAKVKYKEIFEPNAFQIVINLITRNDYKMKVIRVLSVNIRFTKLNDVGVEEFRGIKFKKMKPLKMKPLRMKPLRMKPLHSRKRHNKRSSNIQSITSKRSITQPPITTQPPTTQPPTTRPPTTQPPTRPPSSYMECELLSNDKEGHAIKMSEYALTPLNANYYERGLVTFITSLHFLLIIVIGGFIIPYFQSHCRFTKETKYNSIWYWVFTCMQFSFLIISLIMMSIGLSSVKNTKKGARNTKKGVKNKGKNVDKRVIATVGLYFLFLFISNAIGMALQFPTSDLYDKGWDAIPRTIKQEDPNYTWVNRAFNPLMKIKDNLGRTTSELYKKVK